MWAQLNAPINALKQNGISAIQAEAIQKKILMVEETGNSYLLVTKGKGKGVSLPKRFFRMLGKRM